MIKMALYTGWALVVFGIVSIVFRFFSQQRDVGIAITGALLLGHGLIARAIASRER